MSQGGCFKFKSGCSRPSEEIFRDLAEILMWFSESPDVYPKIKKEGRKNIWKYIIELQHPFYPGEISALRTDRFCGDVSGDFTRWCSQGNLLPEISKPWDIGHLELFGTWVGPVGAFCDIYIYVYICMYIYICVVFGYSIWPVCAVMSKWAHGDFPFYEQKPPGRSWALAWCDILNTEKCLYSVCITVYRRVLLTWFKFSPIFTMCYVFPLSSPK